MYIVIAMSDTMVALELELPWLPKRTFINEHHSPVKAY